MKKSLRLIALAALLATACAIAPATAEKGRGGAKPYDGLFPPHEPYGKGVGAMPGRVVWSHGPASVTWDGKGCWWRLEHFDEEAIQKMVDRGVASLAGESGAREGWKKLFAAHNKAHGKSGGYRSGEKIAIKANINGAGAYDDDQRGETRESYTNPVLLKALLVSLVRDAGAAPADITVFDTGRIFPDYMRRLCGTGILKGVKFAYRDPGGANDAVADTEAPVVWSQRVEGARCYFPKCVTEADYLINLANLKGHDYGITLCAKNHFGSFVNNNRMRAPQEAGLHRFLTPGRMNAYTVLTDLMGSHQLGEKTVLYMLDAIISPAQNTVAVTGENSRWTLSPFSGGYTASVFLSQDPVAIDSVGADFLANEPMVARLNYAMRNNPNVENYLHEAGLAASPPSGARYCNGRGERLGNLGVHEHWNNLVDKQYSRNLGKDEGIELIYLSEADR